MQIETLHMLAGAEKAHGLTVVIDVFRAFTLECFAFAQGAERVYPVYDIEEALAMKAAHPDYLLVGERHEAIIPGFDFGNSPYFLSRADLTGRTLVHSTSNGTRGILAARKADRILLGALVNARATAQYIRSLAPESLCLCCMGFEEKRLAPEDAYCAEYITALLRGEPFDQKQAVEKLRQSEGRRFFIPEHQHFAPKEDFILSCDFDRFDFALELRRDQEGRLYTHPIPMR